MDILKTPFDLNIGFIVTLLLPSYPLLKYVSLKGTKSFNILIFTTLYLRYLQRKYLPSDYMSNVQILTIDDKKPITVLGTIDTLNFIQKNKRTACMAQFHE